MVATLAKKTIVERALPRVAALIPAYNPGEMLNGAVESLANSIYPCDVYVVDDGSDVPVAEILRDFPRTKVIRLAKNKGVAPALNAGLREILKLPYDFVARLDADDFCYPERIGTQVEFLDCHPGISAVGTWARFIDEDTGRTLFVVRMPETPELVSKALHVNNVIIHSSTMFRTAVFKSVGIYSEKYPVAEDYELFRRIGRQFSIANIPRVLLDIRRSTGGVSLTRRRRQLFDRFLVQLKYFQAFEPGAWIGLFKTVLLFFFPVSYIMKIKAYLDPRNEALSSDGM